MSCGGPVEPLSAAKPRAPPLAEGLHDCAALVGGWMTMGRLDVSVWNLALPLALAAGCGPQVGVAEGDGDGDGTGTSVSSSDTGPGPECNDASDCSYGYQCVAGHCEYECYCGCGSAPPPPENRFRCAEGGYYECYSDYACDPNEECIGYVCMPRVECPSTTLVLETAMSLSFTDGGPARALAYVPADGIDSTRLAALQDTRVTLVDQGGAVPWVEAGVPLSAMAVGSIDGDEVNDVIVAQAGETQALQVWRGLSDGTLEPTMTVDLALAADELVLGDLQGDGAVDVVLRDAQGVWIAVGDGAGGLAPPTLLRPGGAAAIALLDADGDGVQDLAYGDEGGFGLIWGSEQTHSVLSERLVLDVIGLHAGRFRGGVDLDLVGVDSGDNLWSWLGPVVTDDERQAPGGGNAVLSEAGDVEGDGSDDLLRIDGDGLLRLSKGASPDDPSDLPLSCERLVQLPWLPTTIALNGSDLATTDGTEVTVYRLVLP
ncbi:MAG: VCBS repeat-containing protein [Nannocystaceae bacterium]|nr:VCBS repeat-containing protein [Nannocystaceae bacterium]